MISTLTRYLALSYVRTAIATLVGVVAVVLVVDLADRAYSFRGEGWLLNVLQLYANLSVDLAYQVAPSALLLAAGITVSAMRQNGELTAFHALGNAPARLIGAILVTCAIGCAGLVALNEAVVLEAARKAEEIKATRFRRSGDFRAYLEQQHWFRSGDRLYNLRGVDGEAFTDVTLYRVDEDFSLAERIDARRMVPVEGGGWRLEGATVSSFDGARRTGRALHDTLLVELPESPDELHVRTGKPRQMGLFALWEQIGVREKLGLSSLEYRHELHNRIAYPFAAVPGALLAIRLALRRNRKGHLATALAEGILISLVVFTLLTVFRALGISGQLPPILAAWLPASILLAAGLGAGALDEWKGSGNRVKAAPSAV